MSTKRKSSKTDKSGFHRLSEQDDLFQLFTGEKSPKNTVGNDFAAAVENTLSTETLNAILREKNEDHSSLDNAPPTRKKSKGQTIVEKEIDLHGLTAKEAEAKTESFILTAHGMGLKAVKIITGRGLHSNREAVLPDTVEQTLNDLKQKGLILSFSWEKRLKHKSGAVLAFLS